MPMRYSGVSLEMGVVVREHAIRMVRRDVDSGKILSLVGSITSSFYRTSGCSRACFFLHIIPSLLLGLHLLRCRRLSGIPSFFMNVAWFHGLQPCSTCEGSAARVARSSQGVFHQLRAWVRQRAFGGVLQRTGTHEFMSEF